LYWRFQTARNDSIGVINNWTVNVSGYYSPLNLITRHEGCFACVQR
jgi:hypothetical protein